MTHDPRRRSCRGRGDGTPQEENNATRETLIGGRAGQRAAREDRPGRSRSRDRSVVPWKSRIMPVEGRGLSSRSVSEVVTAGRLTMSPEYLQKKGWEATRRAPAMPKGGATPRLSVLSLVRQVVSAADVLVYAYERCKANTKGAAGVDGANVRGHRDVRGEAAGWKNWRKNSRSKTYQPGPVKRVWIPPEAGRQTADRWGYRRSTQTAWNCRCAAVDGPRTDLPRPICPVGTTCPIVHGNKQHLDAGSKEFQELLKKPFYTDVVDYAGSLWRAGISIAIPHADLMKSVARRISDRHLLQLIKMWLEAPVEETDEHGRTQRTTCRNKDDGRGTPQGLVASPLLRETLPMPSVSIVGWKQIGPRTAAASSYRQLFWTATS